MEDGYVEAFILSCIQQGLDYDEILVALEDEYGLSHYAAVAALDQYWEEY